MLFRSLTRTRIPKGVVVTSGLECARIGTSILEKGGSAVDAAIASLFGEGISEPSTMGLGGGFIMTIYIKEKGIIETLDSREVAPKAATEDMYGGDSNLSSRGGLAVGVPAELRGYWEAYKKYGKLPWKDLVEPSLELCKNGVTVTEFFERVCYRDAHLLRDGLLREVFIDGSTGKPYRVGQSIKRPRIAETLEKIAEHGPHVLYNGNLTKDFVKDIQDHCGIITEEDLRCYKPEWRTPVKTCLPREETLYSTPLPGSGTILSLILNILDGFLDTSDPSSVINFHRIIESFKFGFGRRTELGDPKFNDLSSVVTQLLSPSYAAEIREKISNDGTNSDPSYYGASVIQKAHAQGHGTANICVLAPNGDAVAATSSLNLDLGAGFMSESTGIIPNNVMDDFSSPSIISSYDLPPSTVNFIKPGKRPLSSMSPSIILDKSGDVVLVIGAAGGPKIITSIALAIIKHLWFKFDIGSAVCNRRLHHQLFPMLVEFEDCYKNDMNFVEALHKLGHDYKLTPSIGFNAITAISRRDCKIEATFDARRGGEIAFVY